MVPSEYPASESLDRVVFVYGIAFIAHKSINDATLQRTARHFHTLFLKDPQQFTGLCYSMAEHEIAFVISTGDAHEHDHANGLIARDFGQYRVYHIIASNNEVDYEEDMLLQEYMQMTHAVILTAVENWFSTGLQNPEQASDYLFVSDLGSWMGEQAFQQFLVLLSQPVERAWTHEEVATGLCSAWFAHNSLIKGASVSFMDHIRMPGLRGLFKAMFRYCDLGDEYSSAYNSCHYINRHEMNKHCPELQYFLTHSLYLSQP
ncbi:hypothetical protein ACWJJH_03195 [Endozoicomonadaceae bacterium StTr2]